MSKSSRERHALHIEPAPWSRLVLVCSKCMRRQDREDLRGDLRKALKHACRKDVRVVLSGCLDLCPDDGVAVARGEDLAAPAPRLHVHPRHAAVEPLLAWAVEEGL